jgi:mono/diheme cytochrome c family protein
MRIPRALRKFLAIVTVLVLAVGGFALWSQERVIAGIAPPPRSAFDPALIENGARLAAIGNCGLCHTAPGGADYAGNRPILTPFGMVASTNITPAPGSGIGRWSEEAFRRAMRQGVSRRGDHLYPAFPYDHFTRLVDDDLHALYAFLLTRRAVETSTSAKALAFPLDQRWLMAFWNLLFVDSKPFRPDPQHTAEWNRGAYLVLGLGHCGGCHTPRNLFGAEQTGQALGGGEAEGWRAPALNANSPAPVPWDEAQLFLYLRHGRAAEHGAAAGPMQPIVDGLARAADTDVRAIAAYLAEQQGEASPERRQRASEALARAARREPPKPAPGEELGAAIFAGACASCHADGRRDAGGVAPPRGIDLALSTTLNEADPRDAILILLDGIQPASASPGPSMPGFAGAFSDAHLTALLLYMRAHYGKGPAWTDLGTTLRDIRRTRERQ